MRTAFGEYEQKEALQEIDTGQGIRPRSQKEQLQDQLSGLKERVAQCEEAIAILDKHPDMERLLTLMRQF